MRVNSNREALRVLKTFLNLCLIVGEQKGAVYLDLIHVHDRLGGPLGAQTVADALIQSHAIELAVVGRPPPESTEKGNMALNM